MRHAAHPVGIGLAAVMPVLGDEVVLRADRIVVVQRAIVRNADGRGEIENGARQQMHMVIVQALDADGAQQSGEIGQFPGQGEIDAQSSRRLAANRA